MKLIIADKEIYRPKGCRKYDFRERIARIQLREVQSTEGNQNVKKCHNRFNSSCYIQGLFYNRMIKMEEEDQADLDPLVREIGHARRYPSYPRAPAQGNQMLQSWRGDHFEAPSFA